MRRSLQNISFPSLKCSILSAKCNSTQLTIFFRNLTEHARQSWASWSSSEYGSLETEWVELKFTAFVSLVDGSEFWSPITDIRPSLLAHADFKYSNAIMKNSAKRAWDRWSSNVSSGPSLRVVMDLDTINERCVRLSSRRLSERSAAPCVREVGMVNFVNSSWCVRFPTSSGRWNSEITLCLAIHHGYFVWIRWLIRRETQFSFSEDFN